MPIYEYKCLSCDAHVEKMQKVSDEPLKICEKCGGELEKQWSRSGFQFKGEGWYVTDYAGKKGSSAEKSSGAESTAKSDSASNGSSNSSATESSSKKD